ncbi:MAG: hypothetical protein IID37_14005 [Planctomycetes bacterium]|nr:hypothetical protein [Planctomycetota bacterium]
MATSFSIRRMQIGFALFVLTMLLFYHQDSGANAASRLLTVYALAENGTHVADEWSNTTLDKAIINGRVYSDKAPLSSYLVVPFYWVWRLPGGEQSAFDRSVAMHMGTVICSAIPFVIYGLMLLARVRRSAPAVASFGVWAVLFVLFGTFIFHYGNAYFGHLLGGLLMVAGYALLMTDAGTNRENRSDPTSRQVLLAGLLGGLSVLAEHPLVLTQVVLLFYQAGSRSRRGRLPFFLIGSAGPAVFLLAYNMLITGSPWSFPYAWAAGFPEMKNALALGWPSAEALWGLTFSQYRGAFVFGPVLLLMLLPRRRSSPGDRARAVLVNLVCAVHLTFFACYDYWNGGNTAGPRFLVPAAMLLCYEHIGWAVRQPWSRYVFAVLGAVGLSINILAAATDPFAPADCFNPIVQSYLPYARRGQFNPHTLLVEWGLLARSSLTLLKLWMILFLLGATLLARAWGRVPRQGDASEVT